MGDVPKSALNRLRPNYRVLMVSAATCLAAFAGVALAALDGTAANSTRQGEAIYQENCAVCHGAELKGASHNPALIGASFAARWNGKNSDDLASFIALKMPPGQPGILTANENRAVARFILSSNGQSATGKISLSGNPHGAPVQTRSGQTSADDRPNIFGLDTEENKAATAAVLSLAAVGNKALQAYVPVTEAMLSNPPKGEWLNWRQSRDGRGFSALDHITTANVNSLQLAWSIALPAGTLESTPLVHDGVMFVMAAAGRLQALEAETGDFIWEYRYEMPSGSRVPPLPNRNIALYGNSVFVTTPDAAVVAIDAKTGLQRWRAQNGDPAQGFQHTAGPVVANGVLISGLNGCDRFKKDPCALVGRDPETGRELWRTSSIAQPDQPGGETWADLPAEFRAGGDMWIPGTYDAQLDTFYIGTAQAKPWAAISRRMRATDAALYTNSTLAIDPRTGKIKWWFQHSPGDTLDLDDVFERVLVDLDRKKFLITMGKVGILWKLDRESGKYVDHVEVVYQDVITNINANGGVTYRSDLLSSKIGDLMKSCPTQLSGKNWQAMSYDERNRLMIIPLVQMCGNFKSEAVEFKDGGGGIGGTYPTLGDPAYPIEMPGTSGNFAKLSAIDVSSMKERWNYQQRVPFTTAALSTAGGLTFIGDADRYMRAFDSMSGKVLWKTRLSTAAQGFPITYSIGKKQYLAVLAGQLGPNMVTIAQVGGIHHPTTGNTLYVFQLPGRD